MPTAFLSTLGALALALAAGATPAAARPAAATDLSALSERFEALAARVEPSVVQIFSTGLQPVLSPTGPTVQESRGLGSGFLVRGDGLVLTNAHVVQGARSVWVSFARRALPEGRSVLKAKSDLVEARVLGVDPETDLALLDVPGEGHPFLPLGDSEALRPGQWVLVAGSPRGLEGSISMGVVSNVARQLRPEAPMVFIQTDAPINPGNSGGPMVTMAGEVVGINALIVSQGGGSEGLGFAVPSRIARTVIDHLERFGRVRRGIIGVLTQTIDPVLARGLGLPQSYGVIVADVLPGLPADQAGLEPGDVITQLDGKRLENARQFDVNVYHLPFGRPVALELVRGGVTLRREVVVIERPAAFDAPGLELDPEKSRIMALGVIGLDLRALPPPLRAPLRSSAGVIVVTGIPGTTSRGELRPGDVIRAVNLRPVDDLASLVARMSTFERGDAVALHVERDGRLVYLSFLLD